MRRYLTVLVAVLFCVTVGTAAQQLATGDPDRWEPAIKEFEASDKQHPPAMGGIVFVGASSIVRWNLEESFPELDTLNRGFGGSEMADSAHYASRIVVPYAPRIVVLYPGENDLARGASPKTIGAGFVEFVKVVHSALPDTRIVVIGQKPTPARWALTDKMRETNKLIRLHCESQKRCVYINVWPDMLGMGGKPRTELFVSDGQHMTPEGYKIWTKLVKPHLN